MAPQAEKAAPSVSGGASPEGRGDVADPPSGESVTRGTVEKGDTFADILAQAGGEGAQDYVRAARRVFSMRAFRAGQPYVIVTDSETGRIKSFEYEIDSHSRLVVEGMDAPAARVERIAYVTRLSLVRGVIADSLFQAVADAGESPQLAIRLVDLFGSEINFSRDLRQGDAFSLLVEKRYRDGEYKGYGRVLAATFASGGKLWEAFLFRDGNGPPQYYNSRGENLRRSFLQSPLAVTRITSRFTKNRLHPILGYSRPHEGVDYGAPVGTPVKAVGEGVVTGRGWAGGYGNQVIVRHEGGLESLYSHLSGYARGIREGQRVRQGQVIGFVGSTGLSTGPHLDFRLRRDGRFINPVKAVNPRSAPVDARNMAGFFRTMEAERALLNGERAVSAYDAGAIVPEAPIPPPQVGGAGSAPAGPADGAEKGKRDAEDRRKGR